MNYPKYAKYDKVISDYLFGIGVRKSCTYLGKGKHFDDDKEKRDRYQVTFTRDGGKFFSVVFGDSINNTNEGYSKIVSSYDVLSCIQKYEPASSIDEFVDEFGLDGEKTSKIQKLYAAVCKEWEDVSGFFTEEELEKLREIAV